MSPTSSPHQVRDALAANEEGERATLLRTLLALSFDFAFQSVRCDVCGGARASEELIPPAVSLFSLFPRLIGATLEVVRQEERGGQIHRLDEEELMVVVVARCH